MDEPNPNQVPGSGSRAPTRERQNVLSENQTRHREHDRHRRRRDLLRAQVGQSIQPIATSAPYSPVSSTPRRLRDRTEDETMGNLAVMSSPSFAHTSPTFSPEYLIQGIDDGPEGEIMGNLPLVSSPTYSPVPPGFRPVSPIFLRGNLGEITPIQFPEQTGDPNTIETQGVLPAPFTQDVESLAQQPLSTPAANLRSPDIRRLENIFGAANRRIGIETSARDGTSQTHIQWGSQLADSFTFENIVHNVKDVLSQVNPKEIMNSEWARLRGAYRFLQKNTDLTSASRFMEALKLWKLSQHSAAETSRRLFQYSGGRRSRISSGARGMASEFGCASSGLNMQTITEMAETNRREFDTVMEPLCKLSRDSLIIQHYVQAMGSPAALLIWPWTKAQQVTELTLQQHDISFVYGMTRFIKGCRSFSDVQGLLNHMSTWIDGWAKGAVPSDLALDYLDCFLDVGVSHGMNLPDECLGELLHHHRYHESGHILSRIIATLVDRFHLGDSTNSMVGMLGNRPIFRFVGIGSLMPGGQLRTNAVAAVFVTSDLPTNVMVAPSFSYDSYNNRRVPAIDQAMAIEPEITTILCPIYCLPFSGRLADFPPCHWIGVVVRLSRKEAQRPTMSLELLASDSGSNDASLYDSHIVKRMVLDWLRDRLPNFDAFEIPNSIISGVVAQHFDRTESGVHTLANLIAAGRSSDYRLSSTQEWADAQRKRYLVQILRSAARNLRGKPGQNLTEISLLKIIDDLEECDQWGLRARRRRLGQSFHSDRR